MISGLQILFIDDDPILFRSIQLVLGLYNDVTGADTLAAARVRLNQANYDLVVLDKNLPDGDGLTFLPEIRAHHPHAGIIVITGEDDFRVVSNYLSAGANDYLVKGPHFAHDLMVRIPIVLNSVRAQEAQSLASSVPSCVLPQVPEEISAEGYVKYLSEAEKDYLARVLQLLGWDTQSVSQRLGIGRSTLFKKMQELNIPRRRDLLPKVVTELDGKEARS